MSHSVCVEDVDEPDIDRFTVEDVDSEFEGGNWSGSEMDEEFVDSDEDVDTRLTRKITRQVAQVTRLAEESGRDPITGQVSRHRSLSVRSAARVREGHARQPLTEDDEKKIRQLLNQAVTAKPRTKPWFCKKEIDRLPHWHEYNQQQQSDPADAIAQAALKVQLKKAQSGRTLWTSALQIAKDWDEYHHCCGDVHGQDRVVRQLAGMTVQARKQHSSQSVSTMMAKRIEKRAAFATKADFTSAVCKELEASVLLPGDAAAAGASAASPLVAWDGGSVCHSCYRAVLGIGRTSLFKFKARLNMQANVRLLEKAAQDAQSQQDPAAKHFPRLIALAKKAADKPIYAARAETNTILVKALLLAYCKAYGQHDPGAAGSKSITKTIYTLPQHGVTALHSALNADLAERIVTRRELLDDPRVQLPEPPPYGAPAASGHAISKSTLQRVINHLDKKCNVSIQLTKQKGVCRCTHCDELAAAIARTADGSLERQLLEANLASHLSTANEQRKHFDLMKAEALKNPLELWTITFDGFDKSKTALPHRPRMNKEQELHHNSLIGMHVVGVFAFGAPMPVLAFFNDESVAGGANLSATIVYEVLEKQWQKLVRDYLQQRNPDADIDSMVVSDEQQADAHAYAASKWPRRLHLTFDNTTGEAKNTCFFKAMAALVHYGVFEAITLSMLLVGHTHDIVDQMFRYEITRAHFGGPPHLLTQCDRGMHQLKQLWRSSKL